VLNDVEGDSGTYYAAHVGLASTIDGKSWRDEGYAHVLPVRGRLLVADDIAHVASCTAQLQSDSCYRLGDDIAARNWWPVAAMSSPWSIQAWVVRRS